MGKPQLRAHFRSKQADNKRRQSLALMSVCVVGYLKPLNTPEILHWAKRGAKARACLCRGIKLQVVRSLAALFWQLSITGSRMMSS